jgi:DNA mismatch repair protein MutS
MSALMDQYNAIKTKYGDAILLFRVGDFYETFDKDAKMISQITGISLTGDADSDSKLMAGFSHYSLDPYLHKLVKAGHSVAIWDQLEDPKTAKSLVKRGVTETVKPSPKY